MASDLAGQLGTLTTASRYYRTTQAGQPRCTPTLTQVTAQQWPTTDTTENGIVSVDHAYENGFLKSFMASVIDASGGVNCANAQLQFFTTGSCPDNRLEPIYAALASYNNPDFVVMSQYLNGEAKGWVLSPDFNFQLGGVFGNPVAPTDTWAQAAAKLNKELGYAKNLVMAGLMINADDTKARMQRTNNRVYKAL